MIFWVLLKIISCKNVKLLKAKSSFIKCKVTIAVIFLSMQLIVSMIMLLIKQKRLTKKQQKLPKLILKLQIQLDLD